jgi:hypothetical protein
VRIPSLLILLVLLFNQVLNPALAQEPTAPSTESVTAPALTPEQPTMALPAVPNGATPASSSNPNRAIQQSNEKPPLQGHLARHTLGIRSLPEGRDPDFIIGHFALGIGPFITIPMNRPMGRTAELAKKFVKKWQGKQVNPCFLKLTKLDDNSGGYYFNTRSSKEGPSGWLMPMPKRPGKDKVTPWAIYFDQ